MQRTHRIAQIHSHQEGHYRGPSLTLSMKKSANTDLRFRRFRITTKSAYELRHFCLPVSISSAPTGRIFVKCDIGDFHEERAWKGIGDKLQRPHYLSRVDYERKIRSRRQRTDIGKYVFANRTIQDWNQLPAEMLGTLPCKLKTWKMGVRKAIEVS